MNEIDTTNEPLRPWMEPEVRTLDVQDTAAFIGTGADGGLADDTRS